jgi:excisionase family DNA binding protein
VIFATGFAQAHLRDHLEPEQIMSSEPLKFAPESKASIKSVSSIKSPNQLLTVKEAAHFLRVSLSWLAKARMRGDGPAYLKVGRSVRYTEAALLQWMKSRQRMSTSEQ